MVFVTREHQNPNTAIVDRNSRRLLGNFKDGRFETEDPVLIEKMKPHYKIEGTERNGVEDGECKVEGIQGSSQRSRRNGKFNH